MRTIHRAFLILAMAACAAPLGARGQEEDPPSLDSDGGNFLFIPGIGKIPLPPGAQGFGPGNPPPREPQGAAPKQFGPRGRATDTEPPQSPERRQADEMNRLFARLADAVDERDAEGAAAAILRRWALSGSDTTDLLAARASAAEAAGAVPLARALLDYVVALSPHWPEGFVRRARVQAAQGDEAGALADLETAARLEPRRFDALEALGQLAEKAGNKPRALEAYRKALAISPHSDALRKNEERLRIELEGRDI